MKTTNSNLLKMNVSTKPDIVVRRCWQQSVLTFLMVFGPGLGVMEADNDEPERTCQSEGLGPIKMTAGVLISLRVLRGYLLPMSGMLLYHVLDLAGVLNRLR